MINMEGCTDDVDFVDITSSCDSEMRRPSTKDETVSTGDSSGRHRQGQAFGEDTKVYRLVYTELMPGNVYQTDLSDANDQDPQIITGDDEMMRRYLQDSVQYHVQHDSADNGEGFEHFLFVGNNENQRDEPMETLEESSSMLYENYVGHEVGVSKSLTKGLSIDDLEDFNSSDSFASTESIIPKNIECPKCPKKFMFKADLKRHDRYKHSGVVRSFFCKVCKKPFRTKDILKHHEVIHSRKERRFRTSLSKCIKCDKKFRSYSEMNMHSCACTGELHKTFS